jgi:dihydropteroate synthase
MTSSFLQCGAYRLSLDRPRIMGIVNLTPDSFSGDGLAGQVDAAIAHARAQWAAGADILDLGAESTRPGAEPPSAEVELARLLPVLEAIVGWGVPVSVDTYKPAVMRAALAAGASLINDINALRAPGAIEAVAAHECAVCLMHMQGEPRHMQENPVYADVVGEVRDFLAARLAVCRAAGLEETRLLLDPGFGFGKSLRHNLQLFAHLPELAVDGLPLLVGVSRKSMLGALTGQPVNARCAASVAAAVLAAERGARILRVHDVAETRDALAVWAALHEEEKA